MLSLFAFVGVVCPVLSQNENSDYFNITDEEIKTLGDELISHLIKVQGFEGSVVPKKIESILKKKNNILANEIKFRSTHTGVIGGTGLSLPVILYSQLTSNYELISQFVEPLYLIPMLATSFSVGGIFGGSGVGRFKSGKMYTKDLNRIFEYIESEYGIQVSEKRRKDWLKVALNGYIAPPDVLESKESVEAELQRFEDWVENILENLQTAQHGQHDDTLEDRLKSILKILKERVAPEKLSSSQQKLLRLLKRSDSFKSRIKSFTDAQIEILDFLKERVKLKGEPSESAAARMLQLKPKGVDVGGKRIHREGISAPEGSTYSRNFLNKNLVHIMTPELRDLLEEGYLVELKVTKKAEQAPKKNTFGLRPGFLTEEFFFKVTDPQDQNKSFHINFEMTRNYYSEEEKRSPLGSWLDLSHSVNFSENFQNGLLEHAGAHRVQGVGGIVPDETSDLHLFAEKCRQISE